ncbi:MAG: PAS domain S-box protein [Burkholderiales bacterium]|nr:PAS domain S-box protein [Burkholderiales bacterium]
MLKTLRRLVGDRQAGSGLEPATPADGETLFRTLIERIPDAAIVHVDGDVGYCNPAALQLLGVDRTDDVYGRPWVDFLDPADRPRFLEWTAAVLRGDVVPREEQRCRRSDGSTVPVEVTATAVEFGGKQAVLLLARDISARLRAQRRLEYTVAAMDVAPEPIVLIDRSTQKYIYVNHAQCQMVGYTHDEMMRMGPADVIVGFDATEFGRIYANLPIGGDEPLPADTVVRRLRRKDGSEFPVELSRALLQTEDGNVVIAVARDITERLRAEAESLRFRAAMEVAADAIFLLDRETLRFIDVNQRACDMLGMSREELLQMEPLELDVGVTRYQYEQLMDQAVARMPEPSPAGPDRYLRRKDGTIVPLAIRRTARVIDGRTVIVAIARDVTADRRAEEALRLRTRAVEASDNAIMIVDVRRAEHPIEYVNPAFERMTGYSPAEALGQNARFLHGDDIDQPDLLRLKETVLSGDEGRVVLRNYRKDGTLYWNQLTVSPVRDEAGIITHYVGISVDVSETVAHRHELEHRANHDVLTGLANRGLLEDRLKVALAAAHRYRRMLAVIFIDLDDFKVINDALGHAAGDVLLKAVAERLRFCVRGDDTVARQGGDEFILILTEQTSEESVMQVLNRVRDAVSVPVPIADRTVQVTASVGVALLHPGEHAAADELIRRADQAMYRAKASGRNQCAIWRAP